MGHPIQLLDLSQQGFSINMSGIFDIFDKIGDRNVAIISINGNKRTGKSFLLNYFLRFLNYGQTNSDDWVHGIDETTLQGFDWRGGAERHTVGIWMWSEPYIIKDRSGKDIVLLLLDTQGNFDEQTTFQECAVIFSISLLLSSTLILNSMRDISEDKLQFVEFFTYFAEEFSGETNTSSGELFQRLVFLVRDWQNQKSYPFGYHDDSTPVARNYNSNVIKPNQNQSKEAQNTRTELLKYFNHVSSFLMPHPGLDVFDEDFRGERDLINSKFIENVSKFVPLILSSENIETKKIAGQAITGHSLRAYLTKLSSILQTHKFPDVRTITAATAEVGYSLALKHAIYLYETKIRLFYEAKPMDEQFCGYHKLVEDVCLNYFLNEPKGRISEESKAEKIEELHNRIELIFRVYQANNATRIDREISATKLNAAIAEQQEMKNRLEEQQSETESKLNDLNKELLNVKEEAKVNEIKQQMHSMEENAKMQKKIIEQNLVYLQRITDIHEKYAKEKMSRESLNNANTQQTIQQLRRPDFKLLGTSAAKDHLSLIKLSISLYEQKMIANVEKNPSDNELCVSNKQVVSETLDNILTDQRITNTVREQIIENLRNCFDYMFTFFRESNLARIEKEESEINMQSNIEEQNRVKRMLDEYQREMDQKITDLQIELTSVKEDAKVRELEMQIKSMEENAASQQSLMQKNFDDLNKIIRFEQNKAKENEDIVYHCKISREYFKEDLKLLTNSGDILQLRIQAIISNLKKEISKAK